MLMWWHRSCYHDPIHCIIGDREPSSRVFAWANSELVWMCVVWPSGFSHTCWALQSSVKSAWKSFQHSNMHQNFVTLHLSFWLPKVSGHFPTCQQGYYSCRKPDSAVTNPASKALVVVVVFVTKCGRSLRAGSACSHPVWRAFRHPWMAAQ